MATLVRLAGTFPAGTHTTRPARTFNDRLSVEFSADAPIVLRLERRKAGQWSTFQEQDGRGGEFRCAVSTRTDWRLAIVVPDGGATVIAELRSG